MSQDPNQPLTTACDSVEAQESDVSMPVWLMVLIPVLLVAGAIYFDRQGGWFDAGVYAPYKSLGEVQLYQPATDEDSAQFDAGRMVYGKTCVACHQANGLGTPGQFPPLADSEWVNEPEPGRMIRLVLSGLQGPIAVKGQAYNNVMVPWNSLSDDDIAAVITFVRQNKEWGNKASAVTPEQVKAVRAKLKGRPNPFTADELLKVSPAE
jgi:mono/diheme cytochrome c family protein